MCVPILIAVRLVPMVAVVVHHSGTGVLLADRLELPPLLEDLLRLDVLDGGEFLAVELVAAQAIEVDFLS